MSQTKPLPGHRRLPGLRAGQAVAPLTLATLLVGAGCLWDPSGLTAPPLPDAAPPDAADNCGNGALDEGEACDEDLLDGETCVSQGFPGGTLGCTTACLFDYRGCEGAPQCGNALREAGEVCDGTDLAGATCLSVTGHPQGTLRCTALCALDSALCHTCGDNTRQGGEQCDGDLGGETCESRGFTGGTLTCDTECRFNEGGCYACGDGVCDAAAGERWETCPGDCGWVHLAAGATHSCGLRKDGTAWCWGANDHGQLGDGTTTPHPEPAPVLLGGRAVAIAAGTGFSCAVRVDATVVCWGQNDKGQLGDGTTTERLAPTPVPGLQDIHRVTTGGGHACALETLGLLWCWGQNDKGQLGDASTTERHAPVAVSTSTGLSDARSITAGTKHTCAVATDQTAWCWGDKGAGRLGDGLNVDQTEPSPVSTLTGLTLVRQLAAGAAHTCAVADDERAWCWGDKSAGRLGDGLNVDQPTPSPVDFTTGLVGVTSIAAGDAHSCALRADQAVLCWGENADGAVGDGTTTDRTVPALTDATTGLVPAAGIHAGGGHVLGWNDAGDGWGWGEGAAGQLGDGGTVDRLIPTALVGN